MAKSDGGDAKTPGKAPAKGAGLAKRLLAWLLLVVIVGYIACGVALGSAGVRRAVCERISGVLGVKVEASSSRLGFPLAMVLQDVKGEGYEGGAAGLMLQELRIAPESSGRWRVSVGSGSIRVVRGADGAWKPAGLAGLGALPEGGLSDLSLFTAGFCSNMSLEATGLTVRWIGESGEIAAAGGVSLVVREEDFADRSMMFHSLKALSVVGPGGVRASGLRRDWVAGSETPYREMVREGGETVGGGSGVFWEGTKP